MQPEDNKLGFGPWALLSLIFLVGLLIILVVASQKHGWVGAVGIGGLIYYAAALVGALLGFIFAVPRVIAQDNAEAGSGGTRKKLLDTNTNLERISDWLTTMLVGVGLSQLTNLNGLLLQFRTFLAETATVYVVNGEPSAGVLPAVGPFVLILGAASGFLFMYLLTRLVLIDFFRDSEEKTLSRLAVAAVRAAVSQAQAGQGEGSALSDPAEKALPAGMPDDAASGEQAAPDSTLRPVQNLAAAATLDHASQATALTADDALEVMFELLYKPGGYRAVIQMSGELSRTATAKRAEFWFYLAAAYGQQMHHTEVGSQERASARQSALDAGKQAVRIDRSYRARLWGISNPNSTDNDLALLRDDDEFKQLTGKQ